MSSEFTPPYVVTDKEWIVFGIVFQREVRKEFLNDDWVVYMDKEGVEPLALAPNYDYRTYYTDLFEECQRNGQNLSRVELHYTAEEFLQALRDGYVMIDRKTKPFIWQNRHGRVLTFDSALVAEYVIKIHVHEHREDKEIAIKAIGI